ncbi:MAG: hypothetical protein JEY99_10475 [Spirochaetales bacterium]|nr:hypothetical protein [Spirochaetales bacterium]
MKENSKKNLIIFSYILIWFLVNLSFLTYFPFFHSDETWLAGLTKGMMEKGHLDLTEPFFDLFPRAAHGLKLLFHGFQAPFLKVFGFSGLGIRCLSLTAGAFSLYLFFRLLFRTGFSFFLSFTGMVLLSADIQFIYASHFGRQEILLFSFMLAGFNSFYSDWRHRGIITGLITGLAAGVHPNAFLIAWPVSILFLFEIIRGRRSKREGGGFLIAAGTSSLVFVIASFVINQNFISEYARFGASVGVRSGMVERISDFMPFLVKLFSRVSGTYYTPDIRIQMILLPVLIVVGCILLFLHHRNGVQTEDGTGLHSLITGLLVGLTGILGVTIGIIIIGKYSQPSIIFYFPFFYILLISILSKAFRYMPWLVFICPFFLIIISGFQLQHEILREGDSFQEYNQALKAIIPPGSRVIGNINAGVAFSDMDYLDWRNFPLLGDYGLSVEDYLNDRKIEYLVYPDELDYIYNSRPVWNIMYGNLYPWYEELQSFINRRCRLSGAFSSPGYAMRIVPLRFSKEWGVRVYEVLSPSISE